MVLGDTVSLRSSRSFYRSAQTFSLALSESQRLVVRAIAREPVSSFTEDYRARHFLPTLSTVGTAARRLAADSRIDVVDGKYQLLDPLFAHYCRARV